MKIIQHLRQSQQQDHHKTIISVEVEKPNREGIEQLIPKADVIFFSRAYANGKGWQDPREFLQAMGRSAREG